VVERQANKSLTNLAHWVRRYITENELKDSQLPDVVKGDRRASAKPRSWYARPDHLETMISLAKPVLDKEAKIMKWARVENQHLDHQRPIDLIETDAERKKCLITLLIIHISIQSNVQIYAEHKSHVLKWLPATKRLIYVMLILC
jgi:hypothetical protein